MPNIGHDQDPIVSKFEELRSRQEGALISYLTAGDPNPKTFLSNASALVEGGTDIFEVGIPFSDPIADGPIIQASSQRAIEAGMTAKKALELVNTFSRQHNIPVVILSYYNTILAMGVESFFKTANDAGVSGIVVPDLPFGQDSEFRDTSLKYHIDHILLVSPNTQQGRLEQVILESRGFVYLVSLYGVTGPRQVLGRETIKIVQRVKRVAKEKIPVSVGFGISEPGHVKALMKAGADGAIVGSALVSIVQAHLKDPQTAAGELKRKVRELKQATRKIS